MSAADPRKVKASKTKAESRPISASATPPRADPKARVAAQSEFSRVAASG